MKLQFFREINQCTKISCLLCTNLTNFLGNIYGLQKFREINSHISQCGKVVEKAITIFAEKRIFFPSNQHKDETIANLLYKTPIGECK